MLGPEQPAFAWVLILGGGALALGSMWYLVKRRWVAVLFLLAGLGLIFVGHHLMRQQHKLEEHSSAGLDSGQEKHYKTQNKPRTKLEIFS